MKAIRVNVTQRDIRLGVPNNAARCAVVRAIRRHAAYRNAFVASAYVTIYVPNRSHTYDSFLDIPLPDEVQRFIQDFDAHKLCSPIRFQLPSPFTVS